MATAGRLLTPQTRNYHHKPGLPLIADDADSTRERLTAGSGSGPANTRAAIPRAPRYVAPSPVIAFSFLALAPPAGAWPFSLPSAALKRFLAPPTVDLVLAAALDRLPALFTEANLSICPSPDHDLRRSS